MNERSTVATVIALSILFGLALTVSGWALHDRFALNNERRLEQQRLALDMCREIEALKAAQRQEALKAYRDLDRTLRLLKLKRTAAIERAARSNRDVKLNRFRAEPCPREPDDT